MDLSLEWLEVRALRSRRREPRAGWAPAGMEMLERVE